MATATSFAGEMRSRENVKEQERGNQDLQIQRWPGGGGCGGGGLPHNAKELLLCVAPALHSTREDRSKSHWEGSHPRFSTTSAFRNQQRKPEMCHLSECQNKQEMVITSEEKQGLELRPDHRGHLSNTISSRSPYFMKTLHKYPLKQTH